MKTIAPLLVLSASAALLALGCPGQEGPPPQMPSATVPPTKAPERVVWRESKSGLGFRLSDAAPEEQATAQLVQAAVLPDTEAAKLLARLPALKSEGDDEKSFALRDKSRPAPRPGKTVDVAFPPPGLANAPVVKPTSRGPLTITRHSPEGEVATAPSLNVSFSAPMIAVTSHDDLAKVTPPVIMTPEPPGKWRWLGTQTVVFDPTLGRLPMSTDYKIEVKAGTQSTDGSTLARSEVWTISTPTLKLESHAPQGSSVELEPVFFTAFNQGIDPARLLASAKITAGNDAVGAHLVSSEEVEANETLRSYAKRHESKPGEAPKWMAFKADRPLPKATTITVTFPAGSTSAEGPKPTEKPQSVSFRTYGPMVMTGSHCNWRTCAPLAPLHVQFANVIDQKAFDPSRVQVTPALDDMKVDVNGSSVTVRGRTKGRTKYTVTVAAGLKDRFGQSMERDAVATFDVRPAEPYLWGDELPAIVLDPASKGKLSVFSVNYPKLKVRLYAVRPEDFARYNKWRQDWDYDGKDTTPPGRLVMSQVLASGGAPDSLAETAVSLAPALSGGFGQVLAIVKPVGARVSDRWSRTWVRQWIQVTNLALDAFSDPTQVYAFATTLATGAPESGVEVSLLPELDAATARKAPPPVLPGGRTGADGMARITYGSGTAAVVVAKKGADLAMLAPRYGDSLNLHAGGRFDGLRWFTFDDRRMYKPDEEVHVKGWVRSEKDGAGGDVTKARGARSITWIANDPRGSKITEGTAELDPSDGFDFTFKLPKDVNLGHAEVQLRLGNDDWRRGSHGFEIQEFRRPEFEVGVQVSSGPHLVGGHAVATASAKYYSGGGLPAAETKWTVTRSVGRFTPPNLSGFSFGEPDAGWFFRTRGIKKTKGETETWSARTSAAGEHRLRIDFDSLTPAYPMSLALEASITDVNRQQWSARSTVLVHPADVTAGLRAQRAFVRAGEALPIEAVVSDLDGNLVAGQKLVVTGARLDYEWTPDGYREVEVDTATCETVSGKAPVSCLVPTKRGGRHAVTTVVTDIYGRKSQTRIHVWVTGDDSAPDRELQKDAIEIVPDRASYAPGDTASLLVMAPFAPAEGILTVQRQGIVALQRFRLEKRSQVVTVKLDASHYPSVVARVDLVGAAPRENMAGIPDASLTPRPAHAAGEVTLKVPPAERTLAIEATPRDKKLDPGAETSVDVVVKDARGRPAPNAVVAIAVVDESILALTGAKLPDPIEAFYRQRSSDTTEIQLRDLVWLARPKEVNLSAREEPSKNKKDESGSLGDLKGGAGGAAFGSGFGRLGGEHKSAPSPSVRAAVAKPMMKEMAEPMADSSSLAMDKKKAEESDGDQPAIKLRKDTSALAAWMPRVIVDGGGRASVKVKLPESLTRYRVIAVGAAEENWFGAGESTITARLPLMVRPSAPRFLSFGDRFELPIVLQNQTDAPLDVAVAARSANAKMLDSGGRRVIVPANDRVEVRVPVATAKPGTARFQIAAASGRASDASELSLPVWTPATTEAFATYGVIDEGAVAQPVKMPSGVVKEFGGLEVTTSSTGLQGLTDAVLYLVRYPFDCNEQISSRMMSIAALRDVLGAFEASALPRPEVLAESVKLDLQKLATRQHYSGGFSLWGPNYQPDPWISIHVAHAIERVEEKGYTAPPELKRRAQSFLGNVTSYFRPWYTPEHRRAVLAYSYYVRKRYGESVGSLARALIREAGGVDKMPLESLGFLLPIVGADVTTSAEADAIRRHLANRVTETAGAAHFATSYEDGAYVLLHSDRRADGVILEALIGDQKNSDLIPKLVTGLLGHRKAGRWSSTQENAFVLLALDRYFQTYEKQTPAFVGRAWLGDKLALEQTFQGRSTDRKKVTIPLSYLAELAQPQDLVLQKDGTGRLYYRVGMQYAPADLRPPPMEQGFSVTRVYEPVDDPKDVSRDREGIYHVRAGAKVRVRVTMVAPARRVHVALVDSLPAGLEPMNPALAVTGQVPEDPKARESKGGMPWWWSRAWYEHENMRDERVEAFSSLVWAGVYDYTYVAVATTPGNFVAPPPKSEEMYSP